MRRVVEINSREADRKVACSLVNLEVDLHRGVSKKRRCKHFLKYLDQLKKFQAVLPVILPNEEVVKGVYLELNVVERYGNPQLQFTVKMVDYSHRNLSRFTVEAVVVDSNHVLMRWLKRERVKKINYAMWMMGMAWLMSMAAYEDEPLSGPASLLLPNSGMLLGEVVPGEGTFVASTYISKKLVRSHNLAVCINRDAVVADEHYLARWERIIDDFYA